MGVQRGVQTVSYKADAVIGQFVPVKLGTNAEEVSIPTAQTDIVRGITMIDSARAGEGIDVAVNSGATVLAKVGTGGWTKGDKLGLGADFISLILYNSATHDQVVAIAEETNTAGNFAEATLVLQVKTA
jgi:hypothetical protein